MIFVDTNIFAFAVGKEHPLRNKAQQFFEDSLKKSLSLVTSAEVMQELIHIYLPVERYETLDRAYELLQSTMTEIFPISSEIVLHAKNLSLRHKQLQSRDLIHLACCHIHGIEKMKTFDKALASLF